jgi:putative transcriptional regulator
MTKKRTPLSLEVEQALSEVLAHAQGKSELPQRLVDDPSADRIKSLRKRLKLTRKAFAERFGLDYRAVQDWEQGRRIPDRSARVLLTVIDFNPEAVVSALTG